MMIKLSMALFCALSLSSMARAETMRDPVGEAAHYDLDKDSSRTSGSIRSGTFDVSVVRALPDTGSGAGFDVKIDYDLRVAIIGRKTGSKNFAAPKDYFEPEFMTELRNRGSYQSQKFKVRHEGYADARNMDGRTYANCDKVLIYDIDTSAAGAGLIKDIAVNMLLQAGEGAGMKGLTAGDIENLQIRALAKEGIPVLGAAKIDVSGKMRGIDFIAGGDFIQK